MGCLHLHRCGLSLGLGLKAELLSEVSTLCRLSCDHLPSCLSGYVSCMGTCSGGCVRAGLGWAVYIQLGHRVSGDVTLGLGWLLDGRDDDDDNDDG